MRSPETRGGLSDRQAMFVALAVVLSVNVAAFAVGYGIGWVLR